MNRINAGDLLAKIAMFGIGGWVLENAMCGDQFSPVFRGARVPFLPIYAANGVALTAAAPLVSSWPVFSKGLAYAAIGSAVEYAGSQIDRKLLSQAGGGYGGSDPLARATDGGVNFTRALLWGGLGLIAEKFQ